MCTTNRDIAMQSPKLNLKITFKKDHYHYRHFRENLVRLKFSIQCGTRKHRVELS